MRENQKYSCWGKKYDVLKQLMQQIPSISSWDNRPQCGGLWISPGTGLTWSCCICASYEYRTQPDSPGHAAFVSDRTPGSSSGCRLPVPPFEPARFGGRKMLGSNRTLKSLTEWFSKEIALIYIPMKFQTVKIQHSLTSVCLWNTTSIIAPCSTKTKRISQYD